MGMTIDEAIERYKNNAEYERTHGNLQGCLEFRQLVEWLEKYQKIEQIVAKNDNDDDDCFLTECLSYRVISRLVKERLEDGNKLFEYYVKNMP